MKTLESGRGSVAGSKAWPVVAALAVISATSPLLAQSEPTPAFDSVVGRMQASTPKTDATFGYTMAAGKLGSFQDDHDDAVICAIGEDEGSLDRVGAAYIFLNANLAK